MNFDALPVITLGSDGNLGHLMLISNRLLDGLQGLFPTLEGGPVPNDNGTTVIVYSFPPDVFGYDRAWSLEREPAGWTFRDVNTDEALGWAFDFEGCAKICWEYLVAELCVDPAKIRRLSPWKSTSGAKVPTGKRTSTSKAKGAASPSNRSDTKAAGQLKLVPLL